MGIRTLISNWFRERQLRQRRELYQAGRVISQFVAKDVRRDVEVLDASELDQGVVTVRVRTWNLLYAARGLAAEPDFGEPKRVAVDRLWDWSGENWGGTAVDE